MKSIKIAGLCLVAMLAMSMVAAGTASAAPVWEQCSEGGSATKYETNQCFKASSTGKFQWNEVTSTEKVRVLATLELADTKVPIAGRVSVKCTGEGFGSVGPKAFDTVEKIEKISCSAGENCEKVEKAATPENLPWQTELLETEGTTRDLIRATNGKGAGWAVTCKVLGITKTDVCTTEEGSTGVENIWTHGVSGELLVSSVFEALSKNAKCELGGAGSGEVRGATATLKENGAGLRANILAGVTYRVPRLANGARGKVIITSTGRDEIKTGAETFTNLLRIVAGCENKALVGAGAKCETEVERTAAAAAKYKIGREVPAEGITGSVEFTTP